MSTIATSVSAGFLAVLITGSVMAGTPTFGNHVQAQTNGSELDHDAAMIHRGETVSARSSIDKVPMATATPAVAVLVPVRSTAENRLLPISILGQAGGSELLGGALTIGLVLRYARNRRLV